ncbi:undecaprenyl/decaprenyl-phosphate alpha-N-acetylglucosaminyl 1-phosphate transferase [bacterium]|nr:undecaprenyl/decaprenyl-phosphate alpha-N-acetylglucosaminyl 1-phosphate transferase [bacterium]
MAFTACLGVVFLVALAVVAVGVPIVRAVALRHGLVDRPAARKVHARATPTSGGVTFYVALAAGLLVFYLLRPAGFSLPGAATVLDLGPEPGLRYLSRMFSYLLVALMILAGAGLYDDAFNLRARVKLVLQVLAASLVYLGGFRITQITGLATDVLPLPALLSYLVTVAWIVGLTNAINFMDGLDGLAAGVCAVAAGSLLVISLAGGDHAASLLYTIILAASLGFLGYNFHPARIFMGDCGSMFLGFMLAVAAIVGTSKGTTFLALLLPVGLPIFDVFSAVFRRRSAGRSMMRADRSHLHHRLLDLGFSYRTVVWVFYGVSLVLGLSAIIAAQLHPRYTLLLIVNFVIATVLASYVLEFIEAKVR